MDLRKLKTLIDLVSESNISELEITEADGKVRIVKADPSAAAHAPAHPSQAVGQLHVLGVAVGLGIDDDGLDAHLAAGALDPQRDLAAIGDQDLLEHAGRRFTR